MIFKTVIGKVRFTNKRKLHIIRSHPIMKPYLKNLKLVLEKPSEIRVSSYTVTVLLFYRYFDKIENGKYIVVVVDKIEGLVRTAYLTHRIKTGRIYEKD